ncbi:sensor histidine kinase [Roseateles sp. BYS180W]|uniref:histidine kinase n=1 Tax=Roseateles rivi TaxID=3299028 RepID=A0ABW7FU70_9BURK
MGFDTPLPLQRTSLALGLGVLLCLAGAAAWGHCAGVPRLQLLALSAALAGLGLVVWAWRRLTQGLRQEQQTLRAQQTEWQQRQRELQRHSAQAQQAALHLSLAPVALWAWQDASLGQAATLQPLSDMARRWQGALAQASALQTLQESLATQPSRRRLVELDLGAGPQRCLLSATPWRWEARAGALLALQPVETELQTQTYEAWRQLVQVLTHEIMNSLTPIGALARQAASMLLHSPAALTSDPEFSEDLQLAVDTVARRAEGLSDFVARFRSLSDWPAPQLAPLRLDEVLQRLARMCAPAWAARGGSAVFEQGCGGAQLLADAAQLEQALLNLIRNAEQATAGLAAPRLEVRSAWASNGRLQLSVRDNGPGVPPALRPHIFVPFFSGQAAGRGIGLAVVRHLLLGMGASVRHVSPPDGGAMFVIQW